MTWHTIPRDDAWKQVTPASIAALGQSLWLRCHCGHETFAEPIEFADAHRLDQATPLLRISQALWCSRCGERKAHCRPWGYGMERT